VSRRTEIQVGITVLAALAILLLGVTWLKDFSFSKKVHVWTVRFPRTGGLGKSDEVQVNGIRKGAVEDMVLVGDHVIVRLALAQDVTLTTDSKVSIRNVGLMGEKVIAVDLRITGRAYTERDTIPGGYELGIPEAMAVLGGSLDTFTSLAGHLHNIADQMDRGGEVGRTLHNTALASDELRQALEENRATLRAAVSDLAVAAHTARTLTSEREPQVRQAVDDLAQAAAKLNRLADRVDSLRVTLASVSGKLDRGDGTLGQLVNDRRMYDDLSTSVRSLRELVEDIKKNPKKYLHVSVF
jgi:phospholipid/cholesterol/gamma-HCH transport system substrate-binding protein